VTGTRFDIAVFDFDGTLVQSAAAKRQAFFDIFPAGHAPLVAAVLEQDPEGPRSRVIPLMLQRIAAVGGAMEGLTAESLLAAYGEAVRRGVRASAEVPGASDVLRAMARLGSAYVFSATPDDELAAEIGRRGWREWLGGTYGFPNRKAEVLAMLLERHRCPAKRALVVGDGSGDEAAARANGCPFMKAEPGWPQRLLELLERDNA
jgi:phosphoglycolate phosphatase-like HAD superfamily hydrolase